MSRSYANRSCYGCGIPLSDGYALGCRPCQERRWQRLKRGDTYSPTGYPGEMIDNRTPKGRIVATVCKS